MTPTLQTLIASAKARVAEADAIQAKTIRAKTARTEEARESAQSESDTLRAALDWRLEALVLVFDAWECRCGRKGRAPQGIFLHYAHTRMANSTRLSAPRSESEIPTNIPKRIRDNHRIVSVCQRCAASVGFPAPITCQLVPRK